MKIIKQKKITGWITPLLILVALFFTLQSCVKDYFDTNKISSVQWNPNLAVPLVYSTLTVQNILVKNKNSLIVVNSDNSLTLIYKDTLFSILASNIISIPNQTSLPPYSTNLGGGTFPVSGMITASGSYTVNVNTNNGSSSPLIDSMTFKAGDFNFSLNSTFPFSGQIVISIPTAKKNGVAFSKTLPFTYSGSTPVIANGIYDLTGYDFDMTDGGTTNNTFVVNYTITLDGSSGTTLSNADQVTITPSLTNLQFSKIFGYIGQLALSPNTDTLDFSIFKNSLGAATFTFVNPSIHVYISNSYGVPINASFSQLEFYSPHSGATAITGSPNPLPILSPNFNQVGKSLLDSFALTNANSNFATDINTLLPSQLIYKVTSQTNPAGPTHNNFVLDTSRFTVNMEAELPLYGTAKNFSFVDTVACPLFQQIPSTSTVSTSTTTTSGNSKVSIESAMIRTYTLNGFPINLDMQAYFVDSTYKTIDSLITAQSLPNNFILNSGTVNGAGMVTTATATTCDSYFNTTRINNLKNTKYVIIKAINLSTNNNGATNVKIYSNYTLGIKFGIQVQLQANVKQ